MRKTGQDSSKLKLQYNRFPYPPIPFLALPKRGQGVELSYEHGTALALGKRVSHRDIRILVAGAGTLEPLVVAQVHPHAREIVAVDLSETSLGRLRNRIRWNRVARLGQKLPRIKLICADLMDGVPDTGKFDIILASNVLHHVEEPRSLLKILAGSLAEQGLMRVVTYPKASRIWMRETGKWLRSQGISPETPHLVQKCRQLLGKLPPQHPVVSCFNSCPESASTTGIVDAFLHSCENPLSPLEWAQAVSDASLALAAEDQNPSSQSTFLDQVVPSLSGLSPWIKLQILDDLLELCANPIFWLKKSPNRPKTAEVTLPQEIEDGDLLGELKQGLMRIQSLLNATGQKISVQEIYQIFKQEVGPRVHSGHLDIIHSGLSMGEYPLEDILAAKQP